jgi:hypothetical protein
MNDWMIEGRGSSKTTGVIVVGKAVAGAFPLELDER